MCRDAYILEQGVGSSVDEGVVFGDAYLIILNALVIDVEQPGRRFQHQVVDELASKCGVDVVAHSHVVILKACRLAPLRKLETDFLTFNLASVCECLHE